MDPSHQTGQGQPAYPPAPWRMVGQLWLSLFRVTETVDDVRPPGVYAAAFVRYEHGSELTYSEMLVARLMLARRAPGPGGPARACAEIVDIWVDSPASRAGGRALWAIPKDLCDFTFESSHRGPLSAAAWSAATGRRPIARASFTDVSRAGARLPIRGSIVQPSLAGDGGLRTTGLRGSAKLLPCRGRWEFDPAGPLGWLAGRRRLASFRLADLRVTFG